MAGDRPSGIHRAAGIYPRSLPRRLKPTMRDVRTPHAVCTFSGVPPDCTHPITLPSRSTPITRGDAARRVG